MRTLVMLIVAVSCVAPVPAACAQAWGIRTGLGVGTANIDFEPDFAASDTALSVFAAYDFNRYFAVEASYVDGGSPTDNGVTLDVRHVALMANASLPIGRSWSLSARAGMRGWYWQSVGVKRDGAGVAYGLGTSLELERLQLRLIADASESDEVRIVHMGLQGAWKF